MTISTSAELEAIVNYQDFNSKNSSRRREVAIKRLFKKQARKARRQVRGLIEKAQAE